jgi:AcrR family transcriptional regulator
MPRAFTDTERDAIRARLMDAGRELFARRGIRATTVEQLARAAGISKGAFYLFYPSKEALFFALMEEIETALQGRLEAQVAEAPHDALRMLLRTSLTARDENPVLDLATSEEAIAMMRTMTPEEQRAFMNRDVELTAGIVERLAQHGVRVAVEPTVLAGLLRALVFVGMHRDDIGAEVAPAVQEYLVDTLSRALVMGGDEGEAP